MEPTNKPTEAAAQAPKSSKHYVRFLGSEQPGRELYVPAEGETLAEGEIGAYSPEKVTQLLTDFPEEFETSSEADYKDFKRAKRRLAEQQAAKAAEKAAKPKE